MSKRPLPTIGIDKYTFFKVLTDDAEGMSYGEAYSLPGTVQLSPTDAGGADTFDADNGIYDVETYLEKIGHELENSDVPPEVDALWRGLERKNNGAVVVGGTPKTVYFGVTWRILKTDGTYRYVKYLKGTYSFASNVGGKTRPSSGAADKQTAKTTYTAVQTEYNKNIYMYIDQADIQFGEGCEFADINAFEEAWFTDFTTLLDDEKITMATE